ncbi:MAG: glucose-1-phosphate thymidylyltransferase [Candidatus Pacebacteria bacterium]|nr:glucose-1-phosphate thymidylyltransferase [Candidatus Paceibacterota bacterium]
MEIKHIKTPIAGLNLYLNKVVSDERGSYCDMAPGGTDNELYADGIKHIHASIATKKFVPRGGHYHFKLKENFFTLSGTALWYFYDFNKDSPTFGQGFAIILGHDKLGIDVGVPECAIYKNFAAQVSISPGIYHVFWPLTDAETVVAGTGSHDFEVEDYDRTKVEDVPGAIEAFEEVKSKIIENEEKLNVVITQDENKLVQTESKLVKKIKAIIPAAKNNQQRPFSHTINKHLIPLGGRPMIFYSIENLVNSGIDQIGIIISEKDSLLKQVVGDGSRWGIEIEYIVQKEMTGLGSAIMTARDYINNEPFILYLGDNIINYNIADLVNRYFEEKLNALLLLAKVDCPQRFGVPEIRDGKIVSVEERPMHPKSEFAVTGVYIYDENAFKAMDSIEISDRGQYEISDIHNYYINSNLKLDYQEIDKWWKDRGKPEDLLEGNKFVLQNCVFKKRQEFMEGEIVGNAKVEGNVKIGKGTRIIGKTLIRGPVSIGEGCLIKDSYVGPYTSIGNVSELNGTEIEHSLVMDNVNIYTKEKIVNSVIGRNASIVSGEDNLPRGKKVIIGENSVVGW